MPETGITCLTKANKLKFLPNTIFLLLLLLIVGYNNPMVWAQVLEDCSKDSSGFLLALIEARDKDGIVHLPKGTFIIQQTIKLPSNCTIRGNGDSTRLVFVPPFNGQQMLTNADHVDGNENITIENLKIETYIRSLTGEDVGILRVTNVNNLVIQNLTMSVDSLMYAIDLAAFCTNSIIKNTKIHNAGRGGCIMVRNKDHKPIETTNNIRIINNVLSSGMGDEPLAIFGWLGRVQNVVIQHNIISAQGASFGISVYSIDSQNHSGELSNVKVTNNIVAGGNVGGIGIKGGSKNVEVLFNKISETEQDGIFIHTGGKNLPKVDNIAIQDNKIQQVGRHGILATGNAVLVANNTISDCKQAGIYAQNGLIMNNDISRCSPSILVTGNDVELLGNRLNGGKINTLKEFHPKINTQ